MTRTEAYAALLKLEIALANLTRELGNAGMHRTAKQAHIAGRAIGTALDVVNPHNKAGEA